MGGYKNKKERQREGYVTSSHVPAFVKSQTGSHPGRRILQDVGFQLLHEHLVVEDDDGVVVALGDQHVLKGLQPKM